MKLAPKSGQNLPITEGMAVCWKHFDIWAHSDGREIQMLIRETCQCEGINYFEQYCETNQRMEICVVGEKKRVEGHYEKGKKINPKGTNERK